MFDRDKWQEIFHAMAMNPLRTVLTGLGVLWGIFMLLILLGVGEGLKRGVSADFGSFATNSLYVWTQGTSMSYMGLPKGRRFDMNNEDVQALADNIEGIKVVAPRNQLGGYRGSNLVSRGKYNGSYEVYGDIPEVLKIMPREMINGRFLNQLDLNDKRKVAVIGKRVREVLFDADEDPIGDYIKINGVYFKVVGVFDIAFSGSNSETELEKIYIPFSTFQNAFNTPNIVGWLSILAADGVSVADLEPQVIRFLGSRHKVHPEDRRAFGYWNAEENIEKMNSLFTGINALIWLVGVGTLLAGVIGVSNIMLVVVKERTREIGVRKALGATPFSVVSQVVLESIILTALAGAAGLLIGVGSVELLDYMVSQPGAEAEMFAHPSVNLEAAVTALLVLVGAGAFAGLLPSSRAARVNPIIALRSQ